MTAAVLEDVHEASLDDLAELYGSEDETARAAALAEADRRDRAARARSARRMQDTAWAEAMHAQYLMADEACAGNLLSRKGKAAGVSEWSLWTGPEHVARAYASEELRAWWDENGRLTITEWRNAMATDRAAERMAALLVADLDTEDEPEVTVATLEPEPAHAADDIVMGIPTCADDEPQETLLLSKRPYLSLGDVVVMYGPGSVGKGRINMAVIADVTNGQPIGLDTEADEPADVIVILPEDKHTEQVIPRLIAAGAARRCTHPAALT